MKNLIYLSVVVLLGLVFSNTSNAGISKNSFIGSGQALVIGGAQPKGVDFDLQNRGSAPVEILIQKEGKRETTIILAPDSNHIQYIPAKSSLVLKNQSNEERALVYWHVSGYSSLMDPKLESLRSSDEAIE